jgi:hypothetical protein
MMSSVISNPIPVTITTPVQNMDSSLIEVISAGFMARLGINRNTVKPVFYALRRHGWLGVRFLSHPGHSRLRL